MNKRTQQANQTKKRIVDSARELFVEKGYYNVTVEDIIKKAKSSKGGFYTHFKTKEELIINMLPMVDQAYINFSQSNNKNESITDKISSFINYVFVMMENEVGLEFISAIYSSQIRDLTAQSFLLESDRTFYHVFNGLIEEGQRKGEITTDLPAEDIISILTTCIRGVIYDWCLKKGSFQLVSYGNNLIRMMLNQIKL